MSIWTIRTPSPEDYQSSFYEHVQRAGSIDGDTILDILHYEDPTIPGDTLVGAWDHAGNQIAPVDTALYQALRPLGNLPEQVDENDQPIPGSEGQATVNLWFIHEYSGFAQRHIGDDDATDPVMRLYPPENAPYKIEMRQKNFGSTWGWRVEVVGGVESRDIASRQMRGTGGGQAFPFVQRDSEWYTDGEGNPLQTWSAENDEGFAEPTDVELACRYQGQTEGWWMLRADDTSVTRLFWVANQSSASAMQSWSGNDFWINRRNRSIRTNGTEIDFDVFLANEFYEYDFRYHVWSILKSLGLDYKRPVEANE